jgi:hypothetical protein
MAIQFAHASFALDEVVRADPGESASTAHHAWRSTTYIAPRCDNKSEVPCIVATRRKIMVKKAKLALIATVALVGLASPALPMSFDEDDGTGNALPFSSYRVAPRMPLFTQLFMPLAGTA